MKTETFHLKFITPCFCAGADQAIAELRPASIRGKLRWWFRVLSGSPVQEAEVFGGAKGDDMRSSSMILRVRADGSSAKWHPIEFGGTSNTGYLIYFARASAEGARWNPDGALPQGSSFELQLLWRRSLTAESGELFQLALDCFLLLGSFGLRSTRGLGCFSCVERPYSAAALEDLARRIKLKAPNLILQLGPFSGDESQLLEALGAQLRGLRREDPAMKKGRNHPSPLGSSDPRQTSAVYLRPVKEPSGKLRIVVFEAPADRVLGIPSRVGAPKLRNGVPAPLSAPRGKPQGGRR